MFNVPTPDLRSPSEIAKDNNEKAEQIKAQEEAAAKADAEKTQTYLDDNLEVLRSLGIESVNTVIDNYYGANMKAITPLDTVIEPDIKATQHQIQQISKINPGLGSQLEAAIMSHYFGNSTL